MALSRRQLLSGCVAGCTIAVAGCSGGTDTDDEPEESGEDETGPQVGDTVLSSSFPMEIYDPGTDDQLAQIHWHGALSNSHWHQQLSVSEDRWGAYEMRVFEPGREQVALGESGQFQLGMVASEGTQTDLLEHDISGATVELRGQNSGLGEYVFQLLADGTVQWESPPLQITVG